MSEDKEKLAGLSSIFARKAVAKASEGGFFSSLPKAVGKSYKALAGVADGAGKGGDIGTGDLIRMSLPLLGVGGAIAGGTRIKGEIDKRRQSDQARAAIEKDPEIASIDEARAGMLYDTLQEYAPGIAKDPLIAQSFIKGMLQYGHVDHKVVTDLMTAEKVHRELKGSPFTAMQAIKNVSWIA